MAGLFGLPDGAAFEVDDASEFACVVVRRVPDEYALDTVAETRCSDGDGPSDIEWARKIAEVLNLEHAAVRDGYKSLADRLRSAEAAESIAMLAMQYAVEPDAEGLDRLRAALRAYRETL
jgi:hypothetical protein